MRIRALVVPAALVAAIVFSAGARAADPQVAGLQVALRARGLYLGPIDGASGPATAQAVRALQRAAGLPVDGRADPRTRAALGPLGRPFFGARALARGLLGWDVAVLQFLLAQRGYQPGPIEGYFGAQTEGALRRLQAAAGLAADGVAGQRTLAVLTLGAGSAAAARPAPADPRYAVRPGDTLSAVAARYGTTAEALARENGLDVRRPLRLGTSLRVPRAPAAAPQAASAATPVSVRAALDRFARAYGLDPSLARALAWMESGYQPDVVSPVGAWGVMQILPPTWEFVEQVLLGQRVVHTTEGNIHVGVAYLRHLLHEFGGDERLALAAWFQGARAVRERGLLPETRAFVADVLALRQRV